MQLFRFAKKRSKTALSEGNEKLASGYIDDAIACYRMAVQLDPESADCQLRLGYALKEAGLIGEAEQALAAAYSNDPAHADAPYLLGELALNARRFERAAEYLIAAVKIEPSLEAAYQDAVFALFRLGRHTDSQELLSAGIDRFPNNAQLHFFQGNLLAERGSYSEAAKSYKKCLSLDSQHAPCLANLGNCERHLGHAVESIQHLRDALKLQPAQSDWHSNLLLTLQYSGQCAPDMLFQEHLQFAEKFENPQKPFWPDHSKSPYSPQKRLRVGYVSGDFRDHALRFFFEPILHLHNREKVEVFCYYTYLTADRVTERMRHMADHWRDCFEMADDAMAEQIRKDGIDILIDLSGHTGYNRLAVFARKPAPIQVTWLGYQATTGLSAMDFRITDSGIDPEACAEKYHSEKLMRLSSGAVFQPDPESPAVNRLPALTGGTFTYACLNNPAKITTSFLDAAARILLGTSNTRMMFGNSTVESTALLLSAFKDRGIPFERLVFVEKKNSIEYLHLHHLIDLALDTFPYNGGTTTLHSQWMGVPVVALEGEGAISRVGVQIMRSLGLEEFACFDLESYIAQAIKLSLDPAHLQRIRLGLRDRMQKTIVEKARVFVSELEQEFIAARMKVGSEGDLGNPSSP